MKLQQQSTARTAALGLVISFAAGTAGANSSDIDALTAADATGMIRTYIAGGNLDTSNPFFQSLGTNGRSCFTCHRPETAWSVTPASLQARFKATGGSDPIFHTNDGSNSPLADVSTPDARKGAYSMLLNKAVIRVGLPIPAGAEFSLDSVDDPYGFANASELSLFRRPLPSTNLRFLTAVMADGRETHAPFKPPMDAGANMADLVASFKGQAINATLGHAQAAIAPTDAQVQQIVEFEMGLTTTQWQDNNAGYLSGDDAIGGPHMLANQDFHVGVNDVLGADPTLASFNSSAMTLFAGWLPQHGNSGGAARSAIARGEELFNTKPISITGVGGLNDALGLPVIAGTCTTCHDAPNIGNHSVALPINIGTADASRRTLDMPLYTLRNNATGAMVQTTDPARALITGKWADIGKVKGPVLRGLAARAPYFHNGMAASLDAAIDFYDTRFNIGFTAQEKRDLVAFLDAL